MGQELQCRLQYQQRTLAGKAYLETEYLLFRGEERLKIALKDLTAVQTDGGLLKIEFPGGPAALELGKAAEKWAQKILHPPTRAGKLGLKPGLAVRLAGEFDAGFLEELRGSEVDGTVNGKAQADLVFLAAETRRDLARVVKLKGWLKPAGALWVVYPKSVPAIREIEVLQAGRAAGLKDTKVASFSATQTALRFVIPVAER
ncbi:MAG TPA: hypothetical protein VNY05_30885 [Candidatus Acidoferrales bacterium]|nr:hypothetical protein [Candidatus Acidoferrales bacterium]